MPPDSLKTAETIRVLTSRVCPDCDKMSVVMLDGPGFYCTACDKTFADSNYWRCRVAKPEELDELESDVILAIRARGLDLPEIVCKP